MPERRCEVERNGIVGERCYRAGSALFEQRLRQGLEEFANCTLVMGHHGVLVARFVPARTVRLAVTGSLHFRFRQAPRLRDFGKEKRRDRPKPAPSAGICDKIIPLFRPQ
jgi:hypothetical protein